jgi:hypothetical protein
MIGLRKLQSQSKAKPMSLTCTGAAKWRHFGIDFASFLAKNGSKTAKNRQKSASSSYLSVNYVFLYGIHSLRLTKIQEPKK